MNLINIEFQNKYCPICGDEVYKKYGTSGGHLLFKEEYVNFGPDHISVKCCSNSDNSEGCWEIYRKSLGKSYYKDRQGCHGLWQPEYGLVALIEDYTSTDKEGEPEYFDPITIYDNKFGSKKSLKQFFLG